MSEDIERPEDLFGPGVYEAVGGLARLGHLENAISFAGHRFVIRTLRGDEDLGIHLLTKEYDGTMGYAKAMMWATVALSLISIDGDTEFCPAISNNDSDNWRARFNWLLENWTWPLAERLYADCSALAEKAVEGITRIQDLSERSLPTSWPGQDSLSEVADSEES